MRIFLSISLYLSLSFSLSLSLSFSLFISLSHSLSHSLSLSLFVYLFPSSSISLSPFYCFFPHSHSVSIYLSINLTLYLSIYLYLYLYLYLSVCVNPDKCPLHRGAYNERRASIKAAKKQKDAFAVLLAADTTAADFLKREARKVTQDEQQQPGGGGRKASRGRRKSVSGPLPKRMVASKYKKQSVATTKKLAQANSDAELAAAMRRVKAVRAHQRRIHQVLRVETGKVGLKDPRLAMRKTDPNYIDSPTSPTTPNTAWHKKLMSSKISSRGHKSSKATTVSRPAAVNTATSASSSRSKSYATKSFGRSSFASDGDFEPVTPTSPPPKGFIVHARRKESARAKQYMIS